MNIWLKMDFWMKQLGKHLTVNEEKAVELFIEKLLTEFSQDIIDVRLFGSKARHNADPDSDLDILVLVKRPDYAFKHAILWLAAELSLTYDVLLSPRVLSLATWQKMIQANTLFYRTVCTDGIPLLEPVATNRITVSPILKIEKDDEEQELAFELAYQRALTGQQRFELMFRKSREIAEMLLRHGHRKPIEIVKRS